MPPTNIVETVIKIYGWTFTFLRRLMSGESHIKKIKSTPDSGPEQQRDKYVEWELWMILKWISLEKNSQFNIIQKKKQKSKCIHSNILVTQGHYQSLTNSTAEGHSCTLELKWGKKQSGTEIYTTEMSTIHGEDKCSTKSGQRVRVKAKLDPECQSAKLP